MYPQKNRGGVMKKKAPQKSMSFLKASAIQFLSKYINVALQLVLTAILARLLSPEQYGVMAGITTFTGFFLLLGDMGFGPAIIQFKQLTNRDYGGIFVFSIILGTVLSIAFAALAHPISWFFRDPSYTSLCYLTCICVFFSAANMVPNGLLLKDKKFLTIGLRLIVTTVIGGAAAIFLAYRGFGTAALVWNLNITAILVFFWNLLSIRKQLSFRNIQVLKSVHTVLSYSLYQAGFSIINYFSRNTDHLIIGRFFGSAPLGFYDKAYKLTSYPIQFIPGILGTVLQPYLSAYQNNKEKLFYYQMLLTRFLAIAGSFFMYICLLCGGDIVTIMYGSQWKGCIPLFLILSGSIAFQMVMNVTGGILQSAGRTDLLFHQGLFATIIMLVLVFLGVFSKNLYILTACVSIAFFFQMFTVAYYTAVKAFNHKIKDFIFPVIRILIISSSIAIPQLVTRYLLHWYFKNAILNLIIYTLVYMVLFLSVFIYTGDLKELTHIIKKR